MVRIQIGWLTSHPIRIYCKKCNILIPGLCSLNQDNASGTISFESVDSIDSTEKIFPDFYVEISSELLTKKITNYSKELRSDFSPFMRTQQTMNTDFDSFKQNIQQFLSFTKEDWPFLRRIHELWIYNKLEYLPQQMREYLPEKQFPLNNKLEILRAIHTLYLLSFAPLIQNNFLEEKSPKIFNILNQIIDQNFDSFRNLTIFFNDKHLLKIMKRKSSK